MHIFQKIDQIRKDIDKHRPFDTGIQKTLQEQLRIEWTYNSNAIEGNTLTLGETAFFLREGLTSEGKPLQDYLEAKNHAEAIDHLQDIIAQKRPITEHLIKSLHGVLMKGMDFTVAKDARGQLIHKPLHVGEYKKQPNHVLTLSGKIHKYVNPLHVRDEMEELVKRLSTSKQLHPVERAAIFHYRFVSIHPFDDGNGRMSRLLMNLMLMRDGYYPCIIQHAHRRRYIETLEETDSTKDDSLFVKFVGQELLSTEQKVLEILQGKSVPLTQQTTKLNSMQRTERIMHVLRTASHPLSIGQIAELLPELKRPTLKKDLEQLVAKKLLHIQGKGSGVIYNALKKN
ncbi:MAG: Fic family protein [Candidatus Kerfeldbacteria bacterium]|nr:Fic family protein [Candidatus Kerfeldbacteria bacterium]